MKKFLKKFSVLALIGSLFVGASAGIVTAEEKPFDGEKVNVGIMAGVDEDFWKEVKEKAAKDGIDVEFTLFTDYVQPNAALNDGSIDLNAFQHVAFLDDWNKSNGADLTIIGYTFVSPMGTYSEKIKNLDELEEGATVAIPNDPTNGGRALLALELAGVIKVDDSKGVLVTPSDVTENPKNIKIEEVEAANLPAVVPDVDAAVINTNFAVEAGLSLKDAIFVDADYPDKLNEAYKNVIVARKENKDNELYKQIVKYYQSDEVADLIVKLSGGDKPIWEGAPQYDNDGHRVE